MAKAKKAPRKTTSTWKSIDQSLQSRAVTLVARKRQLLIFLKYAGIFCGVALVFGLVGSCIYWFKSNPHGAWLMASSDPLRKVYFETDGVLTEEWLNAQIEFPSDATLMDINIFAVQRSLVQHGQARQVMVERIFPDALRITVREQVPIMRMVIMDAVGKKHLMMVSEEGEVYPGVNYQKDTLARLPYLIGVALQRRANGFEKIQGIEHVADLLRHARMRYPGLYADWKFVSMADFDGSLDDLGATLQVHTRSSGIIEFSPVDFESQLQELDAILLYAKYNRRWQKGAIEGIDLTLKDPVLRMANIAGAQ